jgi:hypothetical protein
MYSRCRTKDIPLHLVQTKLQFFPLSKWAKSAMNCIICAKEYHIICIVISATTLWEIVKHNSL